MAPSHWTVHPQPARTAPDEPGARADRQGRALSGTFATSPLDAAVTRHASDLAGRARDYDALADLFMGGPAEASRPAAPMRDAAADASGEPESGPAPTIELVVLGHLPVRAAPWATQYCRALADERERTVAFVRLAAGSLSIDLFEPGASAPSSREVPDPVAALSQAAREAAHIVIEAGEQGLAAAADQRVASVTVIAGANEAAMVAAYRSFKALSPAEGGPRRGAGVGASASSGGEHRARYQIAVMGASRSAAEVAIQRVRRASALFLWSEIRLAAVVERIGPTGATSLYRGQGCESVCALLDAMCIAPPVESLREEGPAMQAPEVAPLRDAASTRPALVSLVPGLENLPLRCPDDPTVEIAWGERRVHLLREDGDGRGLIALTAVAAWMRKHAALIALATSQDPRAIENEATLHLFTAEPRSARLLLDASVRIHLLARAESPWFCAELN